MPYKVVKPKVRKGRTVKVISPKAKSKRYQKSPFVPASIKKYVLRTIHRNVENKHPQGVSALDTTLTSMLSTTWGTVIPLATIFNISQGTGEGNRIGNSIKPMNWRFKGYIHNNGLNAIPCVVKMFIIKPLQSYADPSTTITNPTDFFNYGSSTIAPNGSFMDTLRRVNKDKYTVYTTRTFKNGLSGTSASSTNNDYKATNAFNIDLLKYARKHIKFVDNASTPQNVGLYAVFVLAPWDGSSGGLVGLQTPQISYDVEAIYEDA